jgi:hypothetical protein
MSQLYKKFAFYGSESFITVITEVPTLRLPNAISIQSTSPFLFLQDPFEYYPPIYASVFKVLSFPLASPPKARMHLSCPSYMPKAPSISVFMIISVTSNEDYTP